MPAERGLLGYPKPLRSVGDTGGCYQRTPASPEGLIHGATQNESVLADGSMYETVPGYPGPVRTVHPGRTGRQGKLGKSHQGSIMVA